MKKIASFLFLLIIAINCQAMKRERETNNELNQQLIEAVKLHSISNPIITDIGKLIELGADVNTVNEEGESPLLLAVEAHNFTLARVLISHGANIHTEIGQFRMTYLMIAARNGDYNMCELLLEKNAKVNALDSMGMSAWNYANSATHISIRSLLSKYGANPKADNEVSDIPKPTWKLREDFFAKFAQNQKKNKKKE